MPSYPVQIFTTDTTRHRNEISISLRVCYSIVFGVCGVQLESGGDLTTSPPPQVALTRAAPSSGTTATLPEVRVVTVGRLEGKGVSRLPPSHQISRLEIPRGLRERAAVVRTHRKGFLKTLSWWRFGRPGTRGGGSSV